MRVVTCEVAPLRPPPSALRVDAAVACAPNGRSMLDVARTVRGALDGPPPVVGVSGGPPIAAPLELAHALPDDAPEGAVVAQVQRAAARGERKRSRIVLRGDLDDVGLEGLLASLAARRRTCFIRFRQGTRRAEVTLEMGRPIHVRADGVDDAQHGAATLQELGTWTGASFEVIAQEDAWQPQPVADTERPRPAPSNDAGDAGRVALAAAILNACAAYARAFLGPEKASSLLATTWARVRSHRPSLDAFSVSRDGLVTVVHVDKAEAAIPDAISAWMDAFFEEAAAFDARRFGRVQLRDVLGGLTRLVEQMGWANALLESKR